MERARLSATYPDGKVEVATYPKDGGKIEVTSNPNGKIGV